MRVEWHRYGTKCNEECDDIEEAINTAEVIAESGEGYVTSITHNDTVIYDHNMCNIFTFLENFNINLYQFRESL